MNVSSFKFWTAIGLPMGSFHCYEWGFIIYLLFQFNCAVGGIYLLDMSTGMQLMLARPKYNISFWEETEDKEPFYFSKSSLVVCKCVDKGLVFR